VAADPLAERVAAGGLLEPGRAVVGMLSGGADSTCLLDLAVSLSGREAVRALHVNYGLRDEADEDEAHCRALAEGWGVELTIHRTTGAPAGPRAGNLQAWARRQRYQAAERQATELGADVATGHTATDQVETILYRLASSPSRRALLGMRPRDGRLIRPLLGITRAETADYCRRRGLRWREDATNLSELYARNRIRHALVPALEAVHPAAQANVVAVAEVLREEAAVLDELVAAELGNRSEISLGRLRELPPALARLVIQRLADAALGEPASGVGRRAGEVAALSEFGTAALDLPHGVRATARRGVVSFSRTPPLTGRDLH
jgi:tRNA(Ile)-lysidine synthase